MRRMIVQLALHRKVEARRKHRRPARRRDVAARLGERALARSPTPDSAAQPRRRGLRNVWFRPSPPEVRLRWSGAAQQLPAFYSSCILQAMSRRGLQELAGDLSRSWHELGRLLVSRRLLASLHPGATLTPTKLRALDVIGDEDGVRVGELADRIGIDETTATRLVDRLEAAGVAERRRAAEDRRVTLVGLTSTGVVLVRDVARRRQR